jgi:hypothetical protein
MICRAAGARFRIVIVGVALSGIIRSGFNGTIFLMVGGFRCVAI